MREEGRDEGDGRKEREGKGYMLERDGEKMLMGRLDVH